MNELNFQYILNVTHQVVAKAKIYDSSGKEYIDDPSATPIENIAIRDVPSNKGNVLTTLSVGTGIVMQREWVNGTPDWSYIRTVGENGVQGYILTKYIEPLSSYKNLILPKSKIKLQPLTEMGKVMLSAVPWMEYDAPKLQTNLGEWWVPVTLPYTCIDDQQIDSLREEARLAAINKMYEYLGIPIFGIENIPSSTEFNNGLLSTFFKDFYLAIRPESQLMALVVIPAIYVEYLKNQLTQQIIKTSTGVLDENDDLCVYLDANSYEDLEDLEKNIKECLSKQYQSYVNSNLKVTSFNFEIEIFKQLAGIQKIKFLLEQNNIDLESKNNKKATDSNCFESKNNSKIQVCFNNDYTLNSVYYHNNSGQKQLLSAGLSLVKKSHPFNDTRFGYLFLKQKDICSMAPTLKQFFSDYVVDPVPEVTTVTYSDKTNQKLGGLSSSEFGVYIDTALFLVSLAKEIGNIYDFKQGMANIKNLSACSGAGSSSILAEAFKLKAADFRDSQVMYASDIVGIASWICELEFSDGNDKRDRKPPIDIDKVIKDTIGDGPSLSDFWGSLDFSDWRWPTIGFLDSIRNATKEGFLKQLEQIKKQIISFIGSVLCEIMLLAGAAFVGGIAYQFYKDASGSGSGTFTPSPLNLVSKDYGSVNCNTPIQNSAKVKDEDYDPYLYVLFKDCGVDLGFDNRSLPRQYLDDISKILAPLEVLSLLEGSGSVSLSNTILKYTEANYTEIYSFLNTSSKIATFFACIGGNVNQDQKDTIKQDIIAKISSPEDCFDFCEDLKQKMKDKCNYQEIYESVCQKEFISKGETYSKIIALLDDDCSIQPKFFNDPNTGEVGILSSDQNKPQNQAYNVDNMAKAVINPIQVFIESESISYFNKLANPLEQISEKYNKSELVKKDQQGKVYEIISSQSPPKYRIYSNGNEEITNLSLGVGFNIENIQIPAPMEIPASIDNSIKNTEGYNNSKQIGLSRHQLLFYGFIERYFKNYSFKGYGGLYEPPMPYYIDKTDFPQSLSEYTDSLYSLIFEQLMERYARRVGYMWEGDQKQYLDAYSLALRSGIPKIIDIQGSIDKMNQYIDTGDYDDPNNQNNISPTQYSILNGVFEIYFRFYIMEYFCVTMPFYEVFQGENLNAYAKQEFVKDYIKQKIKLDLEAANKYSLFLQFMNSTYDFIYERTDYALSEQQYTGANRAIDYYIDKNISNVFQEFQSQLAKSSVKKSKSLVRKNKFVYYEDPSSKAGLDVHNCSGVGNIISQDMIDSCNKNSIAGSQNISSYTLHNDRYKHFKNGMFFVQNYVYFEEKKYLLTSTPNFSGKNPYYRGMVGVSAIKEYNNFITSDNYQNEQLSSLFKNIKFGSRLCYGIAYNHDDEDESVDQKVKDFALNMFKDYMATKSNIDGTKNSGKYSSSQIDEFTKACMDNKYLVCIDGSSANFRKSSGIDAGEESDSLLGPMTNDYYTPDGTFSIVIPIFNVENEDPLGVDLDNMVWTTFYNKFKNIGRLSDIEEFQNLTNQLFNSDEYKLLKESCFYLENMIHYNALAGIQIYKNNQDIKNAFINTKEYMRNAIQAVISAKKISL